VEPRLQLLGPEALVKKLVMALFVATVALTGCNQTSQTVIFAPSSVIVIDDADAIAWEGGFLWVAAEPIDPTVTVDVTAVANTIPAAFTPAGCANVMVTGNVILLQMDECAGPFGINRATGSVTYTITSLSNGVQIAASATNLQIGGGNLTINATGVLTTSGANRTLTVTTNGGGIGPNGSSVARSGQYTISWSAGETCTAVNGSVSTGTVNVQTTTFRAFTLCATGCPRSGTVTTSVPGSGSQFTTTYNGSASVIVVSSNGTQSVAVLTCG
jgi:hypothetical protein